MFLVDEQSASPREEVFQGMRARGDRWFDARRFRLDYLFTFLLLIEHMFFLIRVSFQHRSSVMPC